MPLRRPLPALTLLATAALGLAACSAMPRQPVPADRASDAVVPGMPSARFWGDQTPPQFRERFLATLERERLDQNLPSIADLGDAHYLALSGGGSDGAFGAGFLCGWTERGDRPSFKIVTGISTGALIAPFAFLGPEEDHVLREVYTSISTRDVSVTRSIVAGLTSDALADSEPLRRLIAKHVDRDFLARVAAEWRKGRILLIGTTNMDAQRPVMWSMGAIAASGHPDSLELFRSVMLASASIPAVFPPVMIRVEADGRTYDEMHADGGVTSQVFLYPASFSFRELPGAAATRRRHVYVIRNSRLDPQRTVVPRRTLRIAARAVSTLIKTQGVGDLYRIYLGCERDGLDFNLAAIPDSFDLEPKEAFDPAYMKPLFELGHRLALEGYPWAKAPPGFEPPAPAEAAAQAPHGPAR